MSKYLSARQIGTMMNRRPTILSIALLMVLAGRHSSAQTTTPPASTTQGASLAQALSQLSQGANAGANTAPLGDYFRVATALETTTLPLGSSSGAFVTKLDPTTGNQVPIATTFGSSFAERAITAGAGKTSVSANVIVATYDKLGSFDLNQMQLSSTESTAPQLRQTGIMSLVMKSETTLIRGVMGATAKLDIGAIVPIVRVEVNGVSWVQNAFIRQQADGQTGPDIVKRVAASGSSSGLGDIAVTAKYRLLQFGAPPPPEAPLEPDPGGIALMGTVRLPTGSREDLRGLGITRTMGSVVVSWGKGRFRPHGNVGFEWWEKGIDVHGPGDPVVTLRHQWQFVVGAEVEAAPKLTLLLDLLGRQVRGGGEVDYATVSGATRPTVAPGFSSITYLRPTDRSIRELSLVPGVKWNLKGKFLLSLSGVATLYDNGLHDMFTPVVGIDFNF